MGSAERLLCISVRKKKSEFSVANGRGEQQEAFCQSTQPWQNHFSVSQTDTDDSIYMFEYLLRVSRDIVLVAAAAFSTYHVQRFSQQMRSYLNILKENVPVMLVNITVLF